MMTESIKPVAVPMDRQEGSCLKDIRQKGSIGFKARGLLRMEKRRLRGSHQHL